MPSPCSSSVGICFDSIPFRAPDQCCVTVCCGRVWGGNDFVAGCTHSIAMQYLQLRSSLSTTVKRNQPTVSRQSQYQAWRGPCKSGKRQPGPTGRPPVVYCHVLFHFRHSSIYSVYPNSSINSIYSECPNSYTSILHTPLSQPVQYSRSLPTRQVLQACTVQLGPPNPVVMFVSHTAFTCHSVLSCKGSRTSQK